MAKDPAFLFYPGDWLGGTMGFSFEIKGCYFELLIFQFNNGGRFTKAQAKQVLSGSFDLAWPLLEQKFRKEGEFYYNQRLKHEVDRRKTFTESRRINGLSRKKSKKNPEASAKHMEATNETINETIIRGEVIYNAEEEILKSGIWFEQLVMSRGKTLEDGKEALRKYHLHLEEKEQYPRTKKSAKAGFEKWLMNEKNFKNGATVKSSIGKTMDFDRA